ncbi:DNA polymerase III [Candidatus Microgenomates bacterium]|nr:MAG: DNA polymerase III [Candidatus Microgenomates bacterium]
MWSNKEIAKLLRNVASSYAIKDDKKYRFQIIAYQKAADTIENSSTEAKDLFKEGKLGLLPGIGTALKSHIEELLKTGDVKHFKEITKGIPKSLFILLDIPTFGPKRAYKLIKEFSLDNPDTVIKDLERLATEGKIANLEGFGEKSQKDILQIIAEFKKGKSKKNRMPLPYASEIAEKMVNYLKKSVHIVKIFPLGSLRRKVSTIGDIDIAVATNKPEKVIKHFISYPYVERVIEKGPTTASILVSGGKQVDLMTQPPASFGSLLQHFTGSKDHNIHLREYALKKGLSLSEYGIKKKLKDGTWKLENFETEEEFYKALGMDWISPELREDTGEIEGAISHNLPELVTISDIKGDLHTHSDYPLEPSHDLGRDSMENMLKKAIEFGYEYLGFSEHNPSVSTHNKEQIYSILSARKKKIEQLNLSNKNIRVINLLEVDISPNGNLALDDESISLQDALIISVHSSFGMDKKEMTKRIIKGLSHPKAKILAHPTGRKINQRNGYELDWEIIFDFCRRNNKALEINAWPDRLDLPDITVRQAVENKVKLVINTDSHALDQLELMRYGVDVARRGWAKESDILNTLGYNRIKEWLKQ